MSAFKQMECDVAISSGPKKSDLQGKSTAHKPIVKKSDANSQRAAAMAALQGARAKYRKEKDS